MLKTGSRPFLRASCGWSETLSPSIELRTLFLALAGQALSKKGVISSDITPFASKWLPGQDSVTTVETFCFSLRNLPFGFLTRHIRGAFPPYSVGGILASSPAMREN